jgi:hypothetical protein
MPAEDDRDRGLQGRLGKLANKGVVYLPRLSQVRIEALWAGGLKPEMAEDHTGVDEGGIT